MLILYRCSVKLGLDWAGLKLSTRTLVHNSELRRNRDRRNHFEQRLSHELRNVTGVVLDKTVRTSMIHCYILIHALTIAGSEGWFRFIGRLGSAVVRQYLNFAELRAL